MLDYCKAPRRHPVILGWTSLLFGIIAGWAPWLGPEFNLFDAIGREHRGLAMLVAFSPAFASIVFGVLAMLLIPRSARRAARLGAIIGIILSIVGFVIAAALADGIWPFGLHS